MTFKDLEKHLKDTQEDRLADVQKEVISYIDRELPKFLEEINKDFPHLLNGVDDVRRLTYSVDLGSKQTVGILIENDKLPFILYQGEHDNWAVMEYKKGWVKGSIYYVQRTYIYYCTETAPKTTEELMEWLVNAPGILLKRPWYSFER